MEPGLIERRHASLEDGLERLRACLEGQSHLDAEQMCDRVLAEFGASTTDDVVLLILRATPETGLHPARAAPRIRPADLGTTND